MLKRFADKKKVILGLLIRLEKENFTFSLLVHFCFVLLLLNFSFLVKDKI